MPTFKKVDWNDLQNLKERILKVLKEARSLKSFFSLCLALMWLYEYLQCYSKMKLENAEVLENTAVTLKDIKKYVGTNLDVFSRFKNFRDAVGHGLAISKQETKEILFAKDFETILNKFDFEKNFCGELREIFNLATEKPETSSMNVF